MDMFTIGITGPTGSGKTSALHALESLGALALDCDKIYHELLAECGEMKQEINTRFTGVLCDGIIDRKALREIVFNDPEALLDLNAITHKYVEAERDRRVRRWQAEGGRVVGIDAIALIESGLNKTCNAVVGVVSPVETRIARIMTRDGLTRQEAEQRILAQKPERFFEENCDYLLRNVYNTQEAFEAECKLFFANLIGGYFNE
ncbi:MAG: dephospho-CoA kinase [Oscillospiraceae bacterium]|nr:dephospho-CoA kinase [Oscillospiraceae bacterium]